MAYEVEERPYLENRPVKDRHGCHGLQSSEKVAYPSSSIDDGHRDDEVTVMSTPERERHS